MSGMVRFEDSDDGIIIKPVDGVEPSVIFREHHDGNVDIILPCGRIARYELPRDEETLMEDIIGIMGIGR